jgi:hypothetical protein
MKNSDPGAGGAKVRMGSLSLTASPQNKHSASATQTQRLISAIVVCAPGSLKEGRA